MKIRKTICGEYCTLYIMDDGTVKYFDYSNGTYILKDAGITSALDGCGGQYWNLIRTMDGKVFKVGFRHSSDHPEFQVILIPVQADIVYCIFQMCFLIKSNRLFIYGSDAWNVNGGVSLTTPHELTIPAGKVIKKMAFAGVADPLSTIIARALMIDGTIFEWKASNPNIPVQINTSAIGPAKNIAFIGYQCFIAETINDLYVSSFFTSGYTGVKTEYVGVPFPAYSFVSIKKQYTDKGCQFPLKEMVANFSTLHVIDSKDDMYGQGDNFMGEVGNGMKYDYLADPKSQYYQKWGYWPGTLTMYQPVVQIPGKWKNLSSSDTITFYKYVQNLLDQWHSGGRNKSRALGNGLTLNSSDESAYPNGLDMPWFSFVDPLSAKYNIQSAFDKTIPHPQTQVIAPVIIPPVIPKVIRTVFNNQTWKDGDAVAPAGAYVMLKEYDNGMWVAIN